MRCTTLTWITTWAILAFAGAISSPIRPTPTPAEGALLKYLPQNDSLRLAREAAESADSQSLNESAMLMDIAAPFGKFFHKWMRYHPEVQSMVEASAGEPVGWHKYAEWHEDPIGAPRYTWVDVMPEFSLSSSRAISEREDDGSVLLSTRTGTMSGNMLRDESLPKADVLLTQDAMAYLPHKLMWRFLNQTVLACPPKYKFIMSVQTLKSAKEWANRVEPNKFGEYRGFNLAKDPFSLPIDMVYQWRVRSLGTAVSHPRIVQVMDTRVLCESAKHS